MSNGLYTSQVEEDENQRYLEQLRELELGKGMDPIMMRTKVVGFKTLQVILYGGGLLLLLGVF